MVEVVHFPAVHSGNSVLKCLQLYQQSSRHAFVGGVAMHAVVETLLVSLQSTSEMLVSAEGKVCDVQSLQ